MPGFPGKKYRTVDEYLSALPYEKRIILEVLRKTIKKAAPEAEEVISYNMPGFRYHGMLVYYMAHKAHIGFYPGNKTVNEVFKDDLSDYETSKGTIRLPFDKPIPERLIKSIVRYRIKENKLKAKSVMKKS